jgi:hypothetical protein
MPNQKSEVCSGVFKLRDTGDTWDEDAQKEETNSSALSR